MPTATDFYRPDFERRFACSPEIRIDSQGSSKRTIRGYAATYSTRSSDLGGWYERIAPGAFSRALRLRQDVRHLVNHDPNLVLGRTKAGTTTLTEDAKGLRFATDLPPTTYGKDIAESIARGDIDECSFGFVCVRSRWEDEKDASGEPVKVRILEDVDLVDVSIVAYPAYPRTSASVSERCRTLFPGSGRVLPAIEARLKEAPPKISPAELADRERLRRFAELSESDVLWLM